MLLHGRVESVTHNVIQCYTEVHSEYTVLYSVTQSYNVTECTSALNAFTRSCRKMGYTMLQTQERITGLNAFTRWRQKKCYGMYRQ